MGWVTASEQVIERMVRAHEVSVQNPSGFSQIALFKLLHDSWGHLGFVKWLAHLQGEYTKRRDGLFEACDAFLPREIVSWVPPTSGFSAWISVDWTQNPQARSKSTLEIEKEVYDAAIECGALVVPGSWLLPSEGRGGMEEVFFRMTYAAASAEDVEEAIWRLGMTLRGIFKLETAGEILESRERPPAGPQLPPINVTRVIDACEIPLERGVPFNGSFHVYVFTGEKQHQHQQGALADLAEHLSGQESVFSCVLHGPVEPDLSYESRHNPHSALCTFSIVFNAVRASVEIGALPQFFLSYRYHIYSDDARSRKSHAGGQGAAHAKLIIDPREGGVGVVVVLPNGYVGCIVRLVEGRATAEILDRYFSGIVPGSQANQPVQSML
ncbi:hypothetical protein VN97_g7893 [Penicillium thymicola]|uniref:Phenol hydroxylase-like C-terminal dimerisation domain-containing protein n=1 Tax=Penicillium thymicola TaxID=293382 RepID=A0AAI9X652_PENTH|nr:hypothetical protein VN97_g7893 [Penicillium thymicola]